MRVLGPPLECSVCESIVIDINGRLGPNTRWRGFFEFWITLAGIYPKRILGDGRGCVANSFTDITSEGCSGKVLTEETMKY